MPGAPSPVRIAGFVRVASHQAGLDLVRRDDVARRHRAGAGGARPEQGGQAQGNQHQAMHQPILTGCWDTVNVSCILPPRDLPLVPLPGLETAMAENKTTLTNASAAAFIAGIADETRRKD